MASMVHLLMLAAFAVVGCRGKPFQFGFGVTVKDELTLGAKEKLEGKVGIKDWKLGAKGSLQGEGSADAKREVISYGYIAKSNPGDKEAKGIGFYGDTVGRVGGKVSADVSGNGALGRGDRLLSLSKGKTGTGGLKKEKYGGLDGDIHFMGGDELKAIADMHARGRASQPYGDRPTTESFFD